MPSFAVLRRNKTNSWDIVDNNVTADTEQIACEDVAKAAVGGGEGIYVAVPRVNLVGYRITVTRVAEVQTEIVPLS